jgi:hypothetical protein
MRRAMYPFLKDELVLQEIRKHKWIESEKAGREIGFATAAYDWICRHGEDWLRHQISVSTNRVRALEAALERNKDKRVHV